MPSSLLFCRCNVKRGTIFINYLIFRFKFKSILKETQEHPPAMTINLGGTKLNKSSAERLGVLKKGARVNGADTIAIVFPSCLRQEELSQKTLCSRFALAQRNDSLKTHNFYCDIMFAPSASLGCSE